VRVLIFHSFDLRMTMTIAQLLGNTLNHGIGSPNIVDAVRKDAELQLEAFSRDNFVSTTN
jgi:hypothetical protein